MTLPVNLLRMAPWAHAFLAEVLPPGSLAVDLAAGNGHDAHFLYRLVGERGRVLAFDVQHEALQATAELLGQQGGEGLVRSVEAWCIVHGPGNLSGPRLP